MPVKSSLPFKSVGNEPMIARMKLCSILLLFTGLSAFASPNSICDNDGRVPYEDMRIGRLRIGDFESACTVTMIGKSCALTAGHCIPQVRDVVEFGVPRSKFGKLGVAAEINVYEIDLKSITGIDDEIGNDWAVLNLRPNKLTGKLPGELHGFYPISADPLKAGEEISIAGFGADSRGDKSGHGTLQIDRGVAQRVTDNLWGPKHPFNVIIYKVDSMPGNSGGAIIRERTQDIVGIHTNGGVCGDDSGNMGTVINSTKRMQKAITECMSR